MEEELYEAAVTNVFWDVEDFPVPTGRKLDSKFHERIKLALDLEGYLGDLSIWAYSGKKPPEVVLRMGYHLRGSKIMLLYDSDSKRARLNRMLSDMIYCVCEHPLHENDRMKINLMLIAKDIPGEDTEFSAVLKELKKKHHNVNVFLAIPDDWPEKEHYPHPVADLVWHWTRLFDGEDPIESDTEEEDEEKRN